MSLSIINTALELGLITSLVVLSLFLSYQMLNVCDLSTDGCFTFGASVGAVVAVLGHPHLSLFAALCAGAFSGLTLSVLQCYLGIDSLLAGIIINTALYSVNIAVMGNSSVINLNKTATLFTGAKDLLSNTPLGNFSRLFVIVAFVTLIAVLLNLFLKTRAGYAIRATGNNKIMVASSSINPNVMTMVALTLSNSITALAGCLLGQMQKSTNIDIGSGILTIALASLLIGRTIYHGNKMGVRIFASILGAVIFRLIYAAALRFHMPAFMLKFISSLIVTLAIALPYLKKKHHFGEKRYAEN